MAPCMYIKSHIVICDDTYMWQPKLKFPFLFISVLAQAAMPIKIFVGNLSSETNGDDLRPYFEQYGEVTECDVLRNFGFVVGIFVLQLHVSKNMCCCGVTIIYQTVWGCSFNISICIIMFLNWPTWNNYTDLQSHIMRVIVNYIIM